MGVGSSLGGKEAYCHLNSVMMDVGTDSLMCPPPQLEVRLDLVSE